MIFRALLFVLALTFAAQRSAAELPDFTEIVGAAAPAVVKILVEHKAENSRYQEQLEELPESLRRFFDFPGRPSVQRSGWYGLRLYFNERRLHRHK